MTRDDAIAMAAALIRLREKKPLTARKRRAAAHKKLKKAERALAIDPRDTGAETERMDAWTELWELRQQNTVLDTRDFKRELRVEPRDDLRKARSRKNHALDAALLFLVAHHEEHIGPVTLYIEGDPMEWLQLALEEAGTRLTCEAIHQRLFRLRKEPRLKTPNADQYRRLRPGLFE